MNWLYVVCGLFVNLGTARNAELWLVIAVNKYFGYWHCDPDVLQMKLYFKQNYYLLIFHHGEYSIQTKPNYLHMFSRLRKTTLKHNNKIKLWSSLNYLSITFDNELKFSTYIKDNKWIITCTSTIWTNTSSTKLTKNQKIFQRLASKIQLNITATSKPSCWYGSNSSPQKKLLYQNAEQSSSSSSNMQKNCRTINTKRAINSSIKL